MTYNWHNEDCDDTTCWATAMRCAELDRLAEAVATRAERMGAPVDGGLQIDEWVNGLIASLTTEQEADHATD